MHRFTEEELTQCNGKDGAPAYIAYKGKVYGFDERGRRAQRGAILGRVLKRDGQYEDIRAEGIESLIGSKQKEGAVVTAVEIEAVRDNREITVSVPDSGEGGAR